MEYSYKMTKNNLEYVLLKCSTKVEEKCLTLKQENYYIYV